jgi:hypothetical protein
MNELTSGERMLLKWVLQEVKNQYYSQPLESLADVCEAIDLGQAPDGLERPYYGMSAKHQLIFLSEYVKEMGE